MKTYSSYFIRRVCFVVVAILTSVLIEAKLFAQTETVLYDFENQPVGIVPEAGLVADKLGALYGTTTQGGIAQGMVFKLTRPRVKGQPWVETTIYTFGSGVGCCGVDGNFATNLGALVFDKSGNLYGTTVYGGDHGNGTVFELTPPTSGETWTETILYSFGFGSDAQNPLAGLTMVGGVLYGTTRAGGTSGAGTVFRLTPSTSPGGAWTETVLYSFTGGNDGNFPMAAPRMYRGSLYGTTELGGVGQCGVIYKLRPPVRGSTTWTETVLYSFPKNFTSDGANPYAAIILDTAGAIYGATNGGFGSSGYGMVFKLTPPNWDETILYAFTNGNDGAGPQGKLIFDSTGALYGTTSGTGQGTSQGSVFKLTPPTTQGGPWSETTLHTFTGGPDDGSTPYAGLLLRGGVLYGTTSSGGMQGGGVAFEVKP
jgi:uncharacterized repeat protein (TIGR03803 family)